MPSAPYTEDALVQQTTADYLEKQLGWQSIYAHNKEDFGQGSLLGRASDREVILTRILRKKLAELNPNFPDAAYDDAVQKITSTTASQNLTATNHEKYNLMRDGVQVSFDNDEGEKTREQLRVFDFATPKNNHFLCVRELWIKGDLYRRRADVIGFVNGLPLLFIECKNIHKNIKAAYEKNYSDYRDTIPHIFHHNAIVMFSNGEQGKIGTITSQWEHFHEWKRLAEGEPGVVDMETMLKGVCNKRTFMDLLENFIVFDESTGKPRKIMARNHQFLGVNRAIESVRNRKKNQNKLGVFWHTQGAGKSYSMVMFTRKVHRKLAGNFTFLVLTDRDDLDTQIYKTFAGCGAIDHEGESCRASSGEHLNRLLTEHKSHVFSLIQKFNKDEIPNTGYTQRDDIIVISDEAHRTQYGTLALNMRNALPNAAFIGFTGTPLFKEDEITQRVFGKYISTYNFRRAVEDNATLPLYYDARGDKLEITIGDLNLRIANKLEELEIEDIDVQQRLEQELKRDYPIMTAGKRLEQVAQDFVQHYSTNWEAGKAMLICIDKITCVRMHKWIEFYWNERINKLKSELKQTRDKPTKINIQRQLAWMGDTITAVVISEEQGEVDKFRKWELDIIPHRRLIKEGIDLPKSLCDKPQFQNKQRMKLDEAFKEPEHPFRIAIVCAMWLTGFDVPSLSHLYLDKPLKAHTLMQAIARANRVHEGKNNGLIVDYCGILRHLRNALATFTSDKSEEDDNEEYPIRPEEELLDDLAEAITLVRNFLGEKKVSLDTVILATNFERNAAIRNCKEAINENDEVRKRFEIMCREVLKKFKACINIKKVNQHRANRDAINIIYKSLQRDREKADISDIIRKLHEVVADAIDVHPGTNYEQTIYDISTIDFERLKQEFAFHPEKHTIVQTLKDFIENELRRLLEQNPLRTNFQERYEEIVVEYNREKDRVTVEETFDCLVKLVQQLHKESKRAVGESLDEESLAVFDILTKSELNAADRKRIKQVSVNLLTELKAQILSVNQWRDKEATRDAVRVSIRDFLWSDNTGLPMNCYQDAEVDSCAQNVFQHVYRTYPQVPAPNYASA